MPRTINLKAIGEEDIRPLFDFFKSQAVIGKNLWLKDKTYRFANGEEFLFRNDVFMRARISNSSEVRYEVISNKFSIGKGGFGEVRPIKGTLALDERKASFKKASRDTGKRRVVKIQNHNPEMNPLEDLNVEYRYTSLVRHCAIKKPVVVQIDEEGQYISFLTMRRLPGESLLKILYYRMLTTQQRIALSKGLLHALKEQVQNIGLIHRDIKPENIMVCMGPPINIHIIDYAFSRKPGEIDRCSGTQYYAAPENFSHRLNKIGFKSDIYSMGRTIALLWDAHFLTPINNFNHISLSPEQKLRKLFSGIDDLDSSVKKLIETTLKGMLSNDPTTRLSLDDAMTAFDRIGVCGTEPVLEEPLVTSPLPTATIAPEAASMKVAHVIDIFGLRASSLRKEPDNPAKLSTHCCTIS